MVNESPHEDKEQPEFWLRNDEDVRRKQGAAWYYAVEDWSPIGDRLDFELKRYVEALPAPLEAEKGDPEPPADGSRPRAVITIGLPCTGKTQLAPVTQRIAPDHVRLDLADFLMEEGGFDGRNALAFLDEVGARFVDQLSSAVADQQHLWIELRSPYRVRRIATRAAAAGYEVHVTLTKGHRAKVVQRMAQRYKDWRDGERTDPAPLWVSPKQIFGMEMELMKAGANLLGLPFVASLGGYDADVSRGDVPTRTWGKVREAIGWPQEPLDPDRPREYTREPRDQAAVFFRLREVEAWFFEQGFSG